MTEYVRLSFPIQVLDSSKLKEFADDDFKFDKNGGKFSKWVGNTVGKGEIAQDSHSVFKILVLQTHKNKVFIGKGLTLSQTSPEFYVSEVQIF